MKQNTPEWRQKQKEKLLSRRTITSTGCWTWEGPQDKNGYGIFGSGKFFKCHRASYLLFKGEIPLKKMILHRCDVPACFNPDHLYIGDAKQNAKDALERGQHPTGPHPKKACPHEKNGNAKLSKEDVIAIRAVYGRPYGWHRLAKIFNISKRQIGRIVKEESWKGI